MSSFGSVSKKLGFIVIFFMLFLAAAMIVPAYFGTLELVREIQPVIKAGEASAEMPAWNILITYLTRFWTTVFPVVMGFALLLALLSWISARSTVKSLEPAAGKAEKPADVSRPGAGKERELAERRMFLHLFSLMQREGRLMDFLAEDLDRYDDAQIGSAVRSIHAGCRKPVREYIDPKPIFDQPEGEEVVVPADFDPGTIKLTGNVVGKPPFKGVLRHKGWQTGRMNLPTLSGRQNAQIIAPAEVEIE